MGKGPLAGIKVVDVSGAVAGPWASSQLAEQGADVILIEKVGIPDVMRMTGAVIGDQSGSWVQIHRNKRAMTLNLNSEEYEGGELRFPEYGNASYKPASGEAVVFSCDLLHEATDVTRGQRYVLLSFIYDDDGLKQLERYRAYMEKQAAQG